VTNIVTPLNIGSFIVSQHRRLFQAHRLATSDQASAPLVAISIEVFICQTNFTRDITFMVRLNGYRPANTQIFGRYAPRVGF
jgi:hypothetical protein